jgi:hypothetical protein
MTDGAWNFVPLDGQELFPRTLGEILAKLLRARFPRDTAKRLEARYDVAPVTSKNMAKGHWSERSIAAVLYGEGEDVYDLLDAIGYALTGVRREEWEEKKFNRIIEEAERAQEGIRRLRTRAALLAERAVDVDDSLRREGPGDARTG